jgi:hypothetical protein
LRLEKEDHFLILLSKPSRIKCFSDHQQIPLWVYAGIPLIITVKILLTIGAFIHTSEMIEIKSLPVQRFRPHSAFPGCVQVRQDATVLTEHIVYVSDEIHFFPVQPIVEGCAALISTKLFVWSSSEWSATLQTAFFNNK